MALYHWKALKLAAAFASDDPTRPALQGVRLEGNAAIGCDGRVLVHVDPVTPANPEEYPLEKGGPAMAAFPVSGLTVDAPAVLAAVKVVGTKAKHHIPALEYVAVAPAPVEPGESNVHAEVYATDLSAHYRSKSYCPGDGEYPRWQQVVKDTPPVATFAMDVHLLAEVFTALSRMAGSKGVTHTVVIEYRTPMDALRFGMQAEGHEVTGLVMPCRMPETYPKLYDKAHPPTKQEPGPETGTAAA